MTDYWTTAEPVRASTAAAVEGKAPQRSTREDLDGLTDEQMVQRLAIDTVTGLVADGRTVVLVEPTPIFDEDPLSCLSGAAEVGECVMEPLLTEVEERVYRSLDERYDAVVSIDLDAHACPRLPVCDPLHDRYPVWRDHSHFTATWMEGAAPLIEEELVSRRVLGATG